MNSSSATEVGRYARGGTTPSNDVSGAKETTPIKNAKVTSNLLPRLEIVAAAILFSTGGAAIKGCTLTHWQVAGFRSLIAAAFIFLAMRSARSGWSKRALLVGAFYGATMVLFVIANKMTTSANTIFLQDTAPLYVMILSPFLLREPIHRRDVGIMALMIAGMLLFFYGGEAPQETAPNPRDGNLLALIAGLTWAGTIIGLRLLRKGGGAGNAAAPAIVIGNLLAFAACASFAFPVTDVSTTDGVLIGYLGVFQIGLAYILLTRAVAHVPALEAVIILLIEPVLNPIWTFVFQREMPHTWSIVGGGIILAATTLKTWLDNRARATRSIESAART